MAGASKDDCTDLRVAPKVVEDRGYVVQHVHGQGILGFWAIQSDDVDGTICLPGSKLACARLLFHLCLLVFLGTGSEILASGCYTPSVKLPKPPVSSAGALRHPTTPKGTPSPCRRHDQQKAPHPDKRQSKIGKSPG